MYSFFIIRKGVGLWLGEHIKGMLQVSLPCCGCGRSLRGIHRHEALREATSSTSKRRLKKKKLEEEKSKEMNEE